MKKYLIAIVLLVALFFSGCTTPKVTKNSLKIGMFSYMADAAMFVECGTNKKFAVALEDDFISLEKAYIKAVHEAGKAIKVKVEGVIALRDGMDGKTDISTLIVKKFISIVPKEICKNQKSKVKSK